MCAEDKIGDSKTTKHLATESEKEKRATMRKYIMADTMTSKWLNTNTIDLAFSSSHFYRYRAIYFLLSVTAALSLPDVQTEYKIKEPACSCICDALSSSLPQSRFHPTHSQRYSLNVHRLHGFDIYMYYALDGIAFTRSHFLIRFDGLSIDLDDDESFAIHSMITKH